MPTQRQYHTCKTIKQLRPYDRALAMRRYEMFWRLKNQLNAIYGIAKGKDDKKIWKYVQ